MNNIKPILPDNPIMQALTRPTTPGGTTIFKSKYPDPVYMVPEGYKVTAHDKEIVNLPVATSKSYKAPEPVTMSTSSSY